MSNNAIIIELRKGARRIGEFRFAPGAEVTVGRAVEADIRIDARDVSRKHAILRIADNGFSVVDLSANGLETSLPLEPLSQLYPSGTYVKIGSHTLVIVFDEQQTQQKERQSAVRRMALQSLIDGLDLDAIDKTDSELRPRVESTLERTLFSLGVTDEVERLTVRNELTDEALGLGPLEGLLRDDAVNEIMVVAPDEIYVEEKGKLKKTGLLFSSENSVRTVIDRIVAPLGRRIDEASPMVDARLADGSRVNAIIPPLALRGSCITIRKFSKTPFTLAELVAFGTLSEEMAEFLAAAILSRQNIVISGGTGSGKTTLLNVLSEQIPAQERIITVEDAAELQLSQPHVVSLESKPPNAEGRGEVTIRELVKNCLRMRPDRIVVGECRGGEALDMLQAMNTGHDGSLTTTHANSPVEAVSRLETLCLMAGVDLPARAIRQQIATAVNIVVQQRRLADGTRRITSIAEITGLDEKGDVELHEVYHYRANPKDAAGFAVFLATGWMPAFVVSQSGCA